MVDNPLCSAPNSPQLPPCFDGVSSPRQLLPSKDAESHLAALHWQEVPGTHDSDCDVTPLREMCLPRKHDGGIPAFIPRVALSTPLPLSRDVEDRITSLGPVNAGPYCTTMHDGLLPLNQNSLLISYYYLVLT